jgi:hypothetical protein
LLDTLWFGYQIGRSANRVTGGSAALWVGITLFALFAGLGLMSAYPHRRDRPDASE